MDFVNKVKGFLLKPSMTFEASNEDTLSDAIKYLIGIAAINSIIYTIYNYFMSDYFYLVSQRFTMMWSLLFLDLTIAPWSLKDNMGIALAFPSILLGVGSKIFFLMWIIFLEAFEKLSMLFNSNFDPGNLGIISILMGSALFFLGIVSFVSEIMIKSITLPVTLLIFSIIGIFISSIIVHIVVLILGGKKGIKPTIKALIYGSTPRLLLGWIPFIGIIAEIWSIIIQIGGMRQLQGITTGKAIIAVMSIILVTIYIAAGFGAWGAFS